MKRTLKIKDNIISGDIVRDIIKIFPNIESKFTQRKQYDEYYYDSSEIEFTLEDIVKLNDLDFVITITYEYLIII